MVHFLFVEKSKKYIIMKTKKIKIVHKLPKGFKIDASLDTKYEDQPLFKDKVDRANHILKTVGIPKFQ